MLQIPDTAMYIHYLKGVTISKSDIVKSGVGDLVQRLMTHDHYWVHVAAGQLWEQWQPILNDQ
jgi:hypothetical protein